MKIFIVFLAIASLACADDVPILKNEQDISPEGVFHYAYETGDGTLHQASGDANSVHGNYKYVSPDGTPIELTYAADENGFQPTGAHVPEVPAAVLRALEWNRAHPEEDDQ